MKINPAHGSVVLVKLVDDSAHLIVQQMNHTIVKGGEDPRTRGVERYAFDTVGFELEFCQHSFNYGLW